MTHNDALSIKAHGRARVSTSLETKTLCVTASPFREERAAVYSRTTELKTVGNTRGHPRLKRPTPRIARCRRSMLRSSKAPSAPLRERAARRAAIARARVVVTETGVVIRTGASAIDDHLAEASPPRQPN